MTEKITKAMNSSAARESAVIALGLKGLTQVSSTEYALIAKNAEGNDTVVIVKVTVPTKQASLEEMEEKFVVEKAEKEAKKAEKEAEKNTKGKKINTKSKEKEEKEIDVEF